MAANKAPTEAQRAWVAGQSFNRELGAAPKPGGWSKHKAAKAKKQAEAERRASFALLLSTRWEARYQQSRAAGADKAAWRHVVAALTAARTVDGALAQLDRERGADGRPVALLRQLVMDGNLASVDAA